MAIFQFTVVKGHQVASGIANDPRFNEGTITAQLPYFKALGLNLEGFHRATLNAKFDCRAIELNCYDYCFKQVKWHADIPAEDFKFARCRIIAHDKCYCALIYQPQVNTKIAHFQQANELELLAPFIKHVNYGDILLLDISNTVLTLHSS